MVKNKTNKLILIIAAVLIVFNIVGCSRSESSSNKTEKLVLTKENIQKAFSDQYIVDPIDLEWGNISATFTTKKNVNRKEATNLIKEIELKIQKNFTVVNSNSIKLKNIDNVLLGQTENKGISIGYLPDIYIETKEYVHKYSISTKFNLLNPSSDVKITAKDSEDGDLTNKIKLKNIDVSTKIGKQTLNYEVIDSDGNIKNTDLDIEITK